MLEGFFEELKEKLEEHMASTTLIVMDGCSLPLTLCDFRGTIIIAAPPNLYVKNLEDSVIISNLKSLTMPALGEDEALAIAAIIGVEQDVVKTNFRYIGGITRYLFEPPGNAERIVKEAVAAVDTCAITSMLSMQVISRAPNSRTAALVAVHSLVLWKVDAYDDIEPRFELVSRYAECLVAKKLALDMADVLKQATMAPMSGAKGCAGALFEAYAIRTVQAGGTFSVRSFSGKADFVLQVPPMRVVPVVVETNTLSTETVPYSSVRISNGPDSFEATLLWPTTTTNLPTFDCFYFHTDGKVYPLQMTFAKTHDLKNSGTFNVKTYLNGILGATETDPVVFVVPKDIASTYGAQKFTGNVNKKPDDMTRFFDQWVIGLSSEWPRSSH